MTPYYADDWLTVYHGDSHAVMAELPAESVHCVVTSPPYWGLRDYGTASWVGGENGCDHRESKDFVNPKNTLGPNGHLPATNAANQMHHKQYRATCRNCGASRVDDQLGLEPTPEAYVANMVAVFREVRRVLRSDGTVRLNLGDSYAGSWGAQGREGQMGDRSVVSARQIAAHPHRMSHTGTIRGDGLKPKDLVGIPWMVAFALRADGWYLRSDIIWAKPNPMPESVTDRPTKSHEYLFLLSKSARYFFDADAVRESPADSVVERAAYMVGGGKYDASRNDEDMGRRKSFADYQSGRNIRSVWTVATAPYPGAHFATFPPKLVEPCIKAGTSERGVCPECGAPWERMTEREGGERYATGKSATKNGAGLATAFSGYTDGSSAPTFVTTGWQPSCAHEAAPVPAVVLDPFAGSGTTGMVAQSLSRRAVLIDLSMDYLGQLMERNRDIPLGLGA